MKTDIEKPVSERNNDDLFQLCLELYARTGAQPNNKTMHDKAFEAIHEMKNRLSLLPDTKVEEKTIRSPIQPEHPFDNAYESSPPNKEAEAVRFAEWLSDKGFIEEPFPLSAYNDNKRRWSNIAVIDHHSNDKEIVQTTQELYNEFKAQEGK